MQISRWKGMLHLSTIGSILCLCFGQIRPGFSQLISQLTQPHRYEKVQKSSDEYFMVISLKEEGIALLRELNKFKNGNKEWELILLDSTLAEKTTLQLEINDRNKMVGYEYEPGHLYVLFRTGETTKNDFELIDLDLKGTVAGRYPFKPDLDFKLTHFSKAGDSFTFGGYVNNEPAVILFKLPDSHISVIPGFFQKDTELVDLRTNQNHTFNAVLIDRGSKDDRKLVFRTYDESGKQLLEDIVPIDEQKSLQTGITSRLEREDLAILGSWGERNSKQSNGFYFVSVNPFSQQEIKYVDFGQLDHFVDFLKPKRAERIKANSKSDAVAGRIPNFISYVMPFKLTEYKEGFLLLAEIYSPVSSMNPYYSNASYGNPYYYPYSLNSYSRFYSPGMNRMYRPYTYGNNVKNVEEIKTSATVLLSFDAKGQIDWDYSIVLDEIKMPGIEQVADYCLYEGKVHFLYKKDFDLKVKTIVLDSEISTDATAPIKTLEPADVIRSERELEGGVRQWVDNVFYVWGYQTIRNTTKEDRVRDVFYINKIVLN